jgi:Tfp pilus assembly protein PilO
MVMEPKRIDLLGRVALAVMVVAFVAIITRQVLHPFLEARRHLGDFREAVELMSQGEEGIERLDRQVREVRRQISESEARLPGAPNLEVFLGQVAEMARQTHVNLEDLKPQGVREHRLFRELEIDVRVSGSFPAIYAFLNQVEEAEQLSRVEQLRVVGDAVGQPVAAELRLSLFFAPADRG